MNINQAKDVIGWNGPAIGRQSIEAALKHCKALIVAARKAGNDTRAAELSEAKAVLKKRIHRGTCEECGATISRGATHCRAHMRKRERGLALPGHLPAKKPNRPNNNARTPVAPVGGPLADLGFYAKSVQRVFVKHERTIGREMLERYFLKIGMTVVGRETKLDLDFVPTQHWPAVFELGAALCGVYGDTKRPDAGVLRFPSTVFVNGVAPSLPEIRRQIINAGGPDFKPNSLNAAFRRLKMNTPPAMARDYKQSRPW